MASAGADGRGHRSHRGPRDLDRDALERSRAVGRVVGMARRPFDPAERGWRKTEYRQGDVTDAAQRGGPHEGRRRGGAPGLRDPERERRHARAERDGSRMVFEAAAKPGRSASVTRRAWRPTASTTTTRTGSPRTCRRAARPSIPTRPEGRGGARARRGAAAPAPDRGLRVPALHRRRSRRAHDAPRDPLLPARRAMPGAVTRLLSSMPALRPVIPDPGTPFQLVHEDDVATRLHGRGPRRGRAGPVQPGRRRHAHVLGRGRRARLVLRAGAAPGGGGHRGDGDPAAARCRRAWAGSTPCASRC